jgi:hypothetical protein
MEPKQMRILVLEEALLGWLLHIFGDGSKTMIESITAIKPVHRLR